MHLHTSQFFYIIIVFNSRDCLYIESWTGAKIPESEIHPIFPLRALEIFTNRGPSLIRAMAETVEGNDGSPCSKQGKQS